MFHSYVYVEEIHVPKVYSKDTKITFLGVVASFLLAMYKYLLSGKRWMWLEISS